jgi:hypothetical protein
MKREFAELERNSKELNDSKKVFNKKDQKNKGVTISAILQI